MSLWWRHYGDPFNHALHVLAGYDNGALVGIAPCYLHRTQLDGTASSCLRFIGDNIIGPDFLDFITAPGCAERFMTAAAHHVRTQCRNVGIELNGIALESVRDGPWRIFRRRLGLDPAFFGASPWIRLPADFAAYGRTLSPGWRHSLERKRRRLAKNCPYHFEVLQGRDAAANFNRFVDLNRQRLGQRKLKGGFRDHGFHAFHRNLTDALAPLGMIELHLLRTDSGEDIAGGYFLKDPESRCYFYYQQGFATHFGKYSPANVLTASSIEFAVDRSAVEFHFLRGAEPYKSRWTRESKILLSLVGLNA